MQKHLLFLVILLFSLTLHAKHERQSRVWNIEMRDAHVELEVDSYGPKIQGHFCIKTDQPPKKCKRLSPQDLSKYEIKFYYPNIAHDVTESVILNSRQDRHEFSFSPAESQLTEGPIFIAQIYNKGSKIAHYERSLAKLRLLREKLLGKKMRWPKHGKDKIGHLVDSLKKIEARLLTKIQGESALMAKREFPIQVNNFISRPSVWINAIEDWQVETTISLGTSFRGEKSWLNFAFTPYPTNEDYWKIEYRLDNALLLTKELSTPDDFYIERFLTPFLVPGEHEIRVIISREDRKHKGKRHWDKVFEKTYSFETFGDSIKPVFAGPIPVPGRYVHKNSHSVKFTLNDELGRIERNSLKAIMTLENGEVLDLSGQLEVLENGHALIPSIHGNQEGNTSYKVSGTFANLPEGLHQLSIKPRDFAGNEAEGASWGLIYDRTVPVIALPSLIPSPLNTKLANLDVNINDRTGLILRVTVNGIPHLEITDASGTMVKSLALNLYEGTNFINLEAMDEAGNVTNYAHPPVIVDTTPPVLSNIKPTNGEVLKNLNFTVSATSNELISKVIVDEKEVAINSNAFSVGASQAAEGEHTTILKAYDWVGNETVVSIDYRIVLKLIRIELVSLEPRNGKIEIRGLPGASNAGLEIEVSGGFLNGETITVAADGSFSALLDYSSSFRLETEDSILNRAENYLLNFNADTTFTGIVKDVNDDPIPGVKVTIQSTGQTTTTNGNGVFAITDPITGDQRVLIDATQVPESYTKGLKSYSRVWLNVSLGNLQRNVLDRVIYLAPILLDGTETDVPIGESVVVSSDHAPGVTLEIPANQVVFPSGVPRKINIMEIPSQKTSIELLEFSEPSSVYALEPSGLRFNEPVKLTLPNPNEFPVGMELVIMSKNSETGNWEPDGVASVVGPGTIETQEGQGITHFSEIYATPYGVDLRAYSPEHRPGIYNDEGALETSVSLPTYKAMGKDIGVNLTYNSFWSRPSVFVTNSINTPSQHVRRNVSASGGGWGTKVKVDGYIEEWMKPEYLMSQFISGDVSTPWLYFDVTEPPAQSTVSYSVDMSDEESGVYPANASYVLQYRYIKVQRIRIRKERRFGGTHTKHLNEDVSVLMDAIFPPPLQTNLYVQNKKNSEFGSGWKLNVNEKILQPEDDKIVVEETSGKLTPYVLKNSVENLHSSSTAISSIGQGESGKINVFKNFNEVGVLNGGAYTKSGDIPHLPITIGIHQYLQIHWGRAYYTCEYSKYRGNSAVVPVSGIVDGDMALVVDSNSRLVMTKNFSTIFAAGALNNSQREYEEHVLWYIPDPVYVFGPKSTHCNKYSVTGCGTELYRFLGYNDTHGDWTIRPGCEVAFPTANQNGSVPTVGYQNGGVSVAKFNQPSSIIQTSVDEYLIADRGNNVIRKFNSTTNSTITAYGTAQTYDDIDTRRASNASIYHPSALARDKFGNLYVASERGYIRKIDPEGYITLIAGKTIAQGGVFKDRASNERYVF